MFEVLEKVFFKKIYIRVQRRETKLSQGRTGKLVALSHMASRLVLKNKGDFFFAR